MLLGQIVESSSFLYWHTNADCSRFLVTDELGTLPLTIFCKGVGSATLEWN